MGPAISFYGDDFTGAAANLLEFHRRGLKGKLFVNTHSALRAEGQLADLDVLGVAGVTRSQTPAQILREVRPAFELFRRLRSRVVQYKICSTFDSSPQRGSFGPVLDVAREIFGPCNIPVSAAHPEFGRYTVFGNHFAVFHGEVFRLDRHPGMSRHPVTPMHESDLRLHLAGQTLLDVGLCDFRTLRELSEGQWLALLESASPHATVFDALAAADLLVLARSIWHASRERAVFTLASHGLAGALADHLLATGAARQTQPPRPQAAVDNLIVLSGSCSPQTASQIAQAERDGWLAIRLPLDLLAAKGEGGVASSVAADLIEAVHAGRSVVVYAAAGPGDPAIDTARTAFEQAGRESSLVIGGIFANLLRSVMAQKRLTRFMLAGGDTSSQTVTAMNVRALSIDAVNDASHEALLRMESDDELFDGVQVLMKAGQNGDVNYFERARRGSDWH